MKTSNTAQNNQYDQDEWGDKESRSKPKHKQKQRGGRDNKRTHEVDDE